MSSNYLSWSQHHKNKYKNGKKPILSLPTAKSPAKLTNPFLDRTCRWSVTSSLLMNPLAISSVEFVSNDLIYTPAQKSTSNVGLLKMEAMQHAMSCASTVSSNWFAPLNRKTPLHAHSADAHSCLKFLFSAKCLLELQNWRNNWYDVSK